MKNKIKSLLYWILQKAKWNIDTMRVSGEGTNLFPKLDGKLLFVIPHADDELLSGWKTIVKYKNNSYIFYCGMTGSKDSIDNKNTRENEIRTFAKDKGLNLIVSEKWEDELIDVINDKKIDYIFLPSYFDWHPEHRLIDKILVSKFDQIERNITFYWYSISVPIQSENCVIMPLDKKEIKAKYKDFEKYYISQHNMPIQRFIKQEIINAKKVPCFAGECFSEITIDLIKKAMDSTNELELNELKNQINKIAKIRKRVSAFYKCLYSENG